MQLKSLGSYLRKEIDKKKKLANEISKKVAIEVSKVVIFETPVDTSQALSNWQLSLRDPETDVIPPFFLGMSGSTQSESAQTAFSLAISNLKGRKFGDKIYISNNVDYIDDLEGGKSLQGQGFVKKALMVGKEVVRNSKL